MKKISIVIPCYRSESSLPAVVAEIKDTMAARAQDYEIVLVDDCSSDGTFQVIRRLVDADSHIKGITLMRNFGQHAALMAGFHHISGDVVVCMDDDGQTPAEDIFKLADKLSEDVDVVYARYENKKHSFFRNFGSFVNDRMTCWLLGKPSHLFLSSYFATKRLVIEEIKRYSNPYPYLGGLVLRTTRKIINVDVHHRQRQSGSSNYTARKLLSLWMNGFTSFSIKPLRVATFIGCLCAVIGFIYGLSIIISRLVNPNMQMGYSSLMSAVLFVGGLIMLMMGMVGEYIGRIFISLNAMPQFVVREVVSHDE